MSKEAMQFFRAGGFDQARLETGADILALDTLDQKLWVALACPVDGLEFDRQTLSLLDLDGSGRVRAADILREIAWLKTVLADPEELVRPGDDLRLSAINADTEAGARVLASARRILANQGRPDADTLALNDALDTESIFQSTCFNGDGVVPVATAGDDPDLIALINDIIQCQGATADRSGADGVTLDSITAFYSAVVEATGWLDGDSGLAGTPDGAEALLAVREKIDGYFLRCQLAAYRRDATDLLNPGPDLLGQLADKGLSDSLALLTPLPLAEVHAEGSLPLRSGVNPAWGSALEAFRQQVVLPVLGECEALTMAQWQDICALYQPRLEWMAQKPTSAVMTLGTERLRQIAGQNRQADLEALVASDLAVAKDVEAIKEVERLLRLRLGLHRLLNNFVSFRDFYAGRGKAIFLAGRLYLDGRSADLCVRVNDVAAHATLAALSRIYLVYCSCQRKGGSEKMTIAAAFTVGDSDQLMVGRNGVFYDREGRDWDATIIKIVDHPISLGQAFWSPYKKFAKMINDQLEKLATLHSQQSPLSSFQLPVAAPAAASAPAPAAKTPAPAAASPAPAVPAAFDVGRFAGIFAAIGLAVGAIGTAIASVVTGFLRLTWWQMPLAVLGLVLVISGPAMVIAYLKLRQRNLAPILDATGWAVNARVRINIPFGNSLTTQARLPAGAVRSLHDPFAEKKQPWGVYLVLLAACVLAGAVWWSGLLPL